ncbi:Ig-like domain-containing protein [Thiothrix winogradskyi]|uniref:Ig-like domain-containing protein n=1 Tax=Thiothrix winogradskyi TaxID=96472 RepID=A0ABY3SXT0_9GAMM|nr:Ig-like domain-containing protein [Thiothrix winogradskyi]UJS24332.1 Ig-like domain-containing protein [Thiothrix winogradskyi]
MGFTRLSVFLLLLCCSLISSVYAANTKPIALPQAATLLEDESKTLTLEGVDADGDALTYTLVGRPANGTLTLVGNQATYVPKANFFGSDKFTFTVKDAVSVSATATVSVMITAIPDAPTGTPQLISMVEDTTKAITLTATDPDSSASSLKYALASLPANGILKSGTKVLTATDVGVLLSSTALSYIPNKDYAGTDRFTFTVTDGSLVSPAAIVSLTITPVNDAPTATAQTGTSAVRTDEDTPVRLTLSGSDPEDANNITYHLGSISSLNGTLQAVAGEPAVYLYTPKLNYNGTASFTFTVKDTTGKVSSAATVSIVVASIPDAPTGTPQLISMVEDTTKAITLTATDPDSSASSLKYALASLPANGILKSGTKVLTATDVGVLLSSTAVSYIPNKDYAGTDRFTFTVTDGSLVSPAAIVSLTITPVNDAPTATAQTGTSPVRTDEDTPVRITLSGSDPEDGNNITYHLGSTSSLNGTLQAVAGETATYLYTPKLNYNGTASFTFTVKDTTSKVSPAATVSIVVASIPDAPTGTPQLISMVEDTTKAITLTATDPDSSASSLKYALASLPANGILKSGTKVLTATDVGVLLSSTSMSYIPNKDYVGTDRFTFTVTDGSLVSPAAIVSLTITPVNDAPLAVSQSISVSPFGSTVITLSGTDVDGDPLTYLMNTPAAKGTVALATGFGTTVGVNTLEYTPKAGVLTDAIMFKVKDAKLTSAVAAKVNITVTQTPNDPPTANAGADITVIEGTSVTLNGLGTDPNQGDTLSYNWLQGTTVKATTASYTFTAPTVTADQSYTYTLEVSDGKGGIATDTVVVTVKNFAFNDAALLKCFGTSVPSEATLKALTTFTCDGIDLSTANLSQLAQLINLRTLDLSHTKLSNISGLAGLTQLTNLNLGFNAINNISALAGMTQLQTLNLSFNAISDISALTGMNNLQALYLDANNLTTISALANKSALTKLYLDANQLTAITALASSSNLTELGLSHNQLSTITTLSGMSTLQVLALDGNNLSDISGLSGLSSLQTLYLRGNLLSNVAAISGLANLKTLELGFNTISTLPSLSSMTALQHVGLEHNALTDITALSGKTSLKSVFLEHNEIPSNTATINTLKTLTGLNTLIRLEHNRLLDVNGLTTLGGSNNLALTLEDNCLGSVSLPSRIKVVGRSWQFLASRCSTAGENNAPVAYDKTSVITQGTTAVITLDAVDPDSGDTLIYALSDVNVSNGTLNTGNLSNGSVSFTASATVGSAGSFKFRVTDNGGLQSSLATITLQISEPPPSVTDALLVQHCFGGGEPSEATLVVTSTLNCTSGGNLVGANFADLSDLPNLTELSMENASLTNTDLAALAQALPNLIKLTLSGNQISDASGLAGMTQLVTLLLDDNQLTDISGLTTQNFPALIRLNLSGNTFDTADFTALGTNLPNLIMLFLDNSQLDNADLTALFGTAAAPKLSSMYYLVLRNNSITSIEPLLHLAGVSTLLLDDNNIMDIAALSPAASTALPMPGMSELSVNANRLSSIAVPRLGSLSLLSANRNCLSSAPLTHTNSPPPNVSWTSQRALVSGVCPVAP